MDPLYFSIVYEAMNLEVAPFLKKKLEPALIAAYGENWYISYAEKIMKNYILYNEFSKKISQGETPLGAMDISALSFFLKSEYAMPVLINYYQWDEWQVRRIKRIRFIRNSISHNTFDDNFEISEARVLNGMQEKQWLNELEDIIKRMKPDFQLNKYKLKLEKEIQENKSQKKEEHRISFFMSDAEDVRNAYCKIHKFDFSEAPIGEPLTGEAPWTSSNADLEDLPWPSMIIEAENEKQNANTNANTWTEKTSSNYKDDMTWIDEKIQETVNKTFDKIDKRVNLLKGLFGGKK